MHVCRLSQINVGDLVGISKATSSLVVRKVTRAVARLAPYVLSFPSTRAQQAEVMRGFYAIAKFPGVLGAIDCTHIPYRCSRQVEIRPSCSGTEKDTFLSMSRLLRPMI